MHFNSSLSSPHTLTRAHSHTPPCAHTFMDLHTHTLSHTWLLGSPTHLTLYVRCQTEQTKEPAGTPAAPPSADAQVQR